MRAASASSAPLPKVMVPRQISETFSPLLPSRRYSMPALLVAFPQRLLFRNKTTREGAGGKIPVDAVVLVGQQGPAGGRRQSGGVAGHQRVGHEDEAVGTTDRGAVRRAVNDRGARDLD